MKKHLKIKSWPSEQAVFKVNVLFLIIFIIIKHNEIYYPDQILNETNIFQILYFE